MSSANKNLYIIGNGFDLHHGISSSYNGFKKFVKENEVELYELIGKYLPVFKQQEVTLGHLRARVTLLFVQ